MTNRMLKLFAPLLFAIFLFSPNAAWAGDNTAKRPNIVLIMADDVGFEGLGCYGGGSYKTPNLDKLAAEGMRFLHCYSMPVCHPSRIAMLTGRYPFRLKNPRWGSFPKNEERNTLAWVLKMAGYATAIAGKWQLTLQGRDPQHPRRLGFDESCLFGWHEGPRYHQPMLYQNGKVRKDVKDRYGPDVYVEFLSKFMKRNKDRPFFAFYSMALCHDVTDDLKKPVPYVPGKDRYMTYEEMIHSMDEQVGKLVSAVDKLGVRENTLILFTTDNGTPASYIHSAEGGRYMRMAFRSLLNGILVRGGKGSLTRRGTLVPLIANWKGVIKKGQTVDQMVDFSDFLPTVADVGGAKLPAGVALDGHSFLPSLKGGKGKRTWAFAERGKKHFVCNQRYKLYSDGRFFDLQKDELEKKPLAKVQRDPVVAKNMFALAVALKKLKVEK